MRRRTTPMYTLVLRLNRVNLPLTKLLDK